MKKIATLVLCCAFSSAFALPTFQLTSPDFKPNASMPKTGGCHEIGISPALTWTNAPRGTKSFSLILTDYDAAQVTEHPFQHWIVYNLPANVHEIARGEQKLTQGRNSLNRKQFAAFCPPNGLHHYTFVLYALDSNTIHYPIDPDANQLVQAMQGHILDQATLVGTFSN